MPYVSQHASANRRGGGGERWPPPANPHWWCTVPGEQRRWYTAGVLVAPAPPLPVPQQLAELPSTPWPPPHPFHQGQPQHTEPQAPGTRGVQGTWGVQGTHPPLPLLPAGDRLIFLETESPRNYRGCQGLQGVQGTQGIHGSQELVHRAHSFFQRPMPQSQVSGAVETGAGARERLQFSLADLATIAGLGPLQLSEQEVLLEALLRPQLTRQSQAVMGQSQAVMGPSQAVTGQPQAVPLQRQSQGQVTGRPSTGAVTWAATESHRTVTESHRTVTGSDRTAAGSDGTAAGCPHHRDSHKAMLGPTPGTALNRGTWNLLLISSRHQWGRPWPGLNPAGVPVEAAQATA